MLTSSKFHTVTHSRDYSNTSNALIKGSSLNEMCLPGPIIFGRKYEDKARSMFLKAHKHSHKKCSIMVLGLLVHDDTPFLAASPDGKMTCNRCGDSLIEVKCLWSKRKFHPKVALTMLGIC